MVNDSLRTIHQLRFNPAPPSLTQGDSAGVKFGSGDVVEVELRGGTLSFTVNKAKVPQLPTMAWLSPVAVSYEERGRARSISLGPCLMEHFSWTMSHGPCHMEHVS